MGVWLAKTAIVLLVLQFVSSGIGTPPPTPRRVKALDPGVGIIESVAITNNSSIACLANKYGGVRVWNIMRAKRIQSMRVGHLLKARAVAISPDAKTVAVGCFESSTRKGVLSVWDVNRGTNECELRGHDSYITSLCVLRRGRIVSASNDSTVALWDVPSRQKLRTLHLSSVVEVVRVSPDEKWVALGARDGSVSVIELASFRRVAKFVLTGPVVALGFSPDQQWLVTAAMAPVRDRMGAGVVSVWRTDTWRLRHTLSSSVTLVFSVHFHSSGTKFTIAGERTRGWFTSPGIVELWDAATAARSKVWREREPVLCSMLFPKEHKIGIITAFSNYLERSTR
jgi:WD40 repeat protein